MTWEPVGEPGVGGRLTTLAFNPARRLDLLIGGDLLGVGRSRDGGGSWEVTTGFEAWEVAEITFLPDEEDVVWIGTQSGPYRSTDGGSTWEERRTGLPEVSGSSYTAPIEVVLVDPTDGERLLAFGGSQRRWVSPGSPAWGAVWESLDGGQRWDRLGTVGDDGGGNVQAARFLAGSSTDLLAAVLDGGVYRSTDGGATWAPSSDGLPHGNVTDLVVHPADPAVAWVTLGAGPDDGGGPQPGGVYRTDDGGRSWTPSSEGLLQFRGADPLVTSRYERIVVAPSDPDRLYTSNVGYRESAVYRSDDGGRTWMVIADASTPRPGAYQSGVAGRELAVHPRDPDVVMFANDESALLSTDGGTTWTDLTTEERPDGALVGRGYSGLVATDVEFHPTEPGVVALSAFDGGNPIVSRDGMETWRRPVRGEDNWGGAIEVAFSPVDDQRAYVLLGQPSDWRGVGRSDDAGRSFTVGAEGLPPRGTPGIVGTGLAVHPGDPDTVMVVVDGTLYRSTDGARTFSPTGQVEVYDVAASPGGRAWFASGATGVARSDDGGETWTPLGGPADATRLTVTDDEVYVTAWRSEAGGLFRYDGERWTRLLEDPFLHEVAVHPTRPEVLVAVSTDLPFVDHSAARGVRVSTDGGATWASAGEGLPMARVATVAFDPYEPDRVVVGTYGRGFYRADLDLG